MATQLSPAELQTAQSLLQNYADAQPAITTLGQHEGDLEASLEDLIGAAAGTATYSTGAGPARKSLRASFIKTLRKEICGNDSFRTQVEKYNKSPDKATLLTGLIVYVVDLLALPFVTPAIATVAVLWILKVGLGTFFDYTEPQPATAPSSAQPLAPEVDSGSSYCAGDFGSSN